MDRLILYALWLLQDDAKSGVLFAGNEKVARRAGCCPKIVQERKYVLERAGLIYLGTTGPDGKCRGGKIRIFDRQGEPQTVPQATWYECHPDLQQAAPEALVERAQRELTAAEKKRAQARVRERLRAQGLLAGPEP